MAKDALGEIFLLGGIVVGGYFIWQWFSGMAATSVTPVTTAAPPPPTPGVSTITQQMQNAAANNSIIQGQGGQADAYQWATIWAQIGQPAIGDVNGIFFPNGVPANASSLANTAGNSQSGLPLMSLSTFLTNLSATGVKGLSGVPDLMNYLTRLQVQQLARRVVQ